VGRSLSAEGRKVDLYASLHIYRPRSRGDNTFGSVRVCVHPFVCGHSPV